MCFRCGGDQEVQIAYQHSLDPQIGLDLPVDGGCLSTQVMAVSSCKKTVRTVSLPHEATDCLVILHWASGMVSRVARLIKSDDRYREGCCATLLDDASSVVAYDGVITQQENAGVGVEQKAHRAGVFPLESLVS